MHDSTVQECDARDDAMKINVGLIKIIYHIITPL